MSSDYEEYLKETKSMWRMEAYKWLEKYKELEKQIEELKEQLNKQNGNH